MHNKGKSSFIKIIEGGIDREEGKNAKDVLRSIRFSKKEVILHVANYYK